MVYPFVRTGGQRTFIRPGRKEWAIAIVEDYDGWGMVALAIEPSDTLSSSGSSGNILVVTCFYMVRGRFGDGVIWWMGDESAYAK